MQCFCRACGFIYDPSENQDISFFDLPDNWVCPDCGAEKDEFSTEDAMS